MVDNYDCGSGNPLPRCPGPLPTLSDYLNHSGNVDGNRCIMMYLVHMLALLNFTGMLLGDIF